MRLLVIGGTGGMGLPLCNWFGEQGFEPIAVGASACDIRDPAAIASALKRHDPEGIVSLAVRNMDGLLHKQTEEMVRQQVEVSCTGSVNLLRAAVPHLKAKGGGPIVFGSSILSTNPVIGAGIYAAGKAFMESLVTTAALENARHKIRVNAVRMGYFTHGLWERVPEPMQKKVLEGIPLGRLGTDDEFASAVAFLLENEYVTGTSLTVAGGL